MASAGIDSGHRRSTMNTTADNAKVTTKTNPQTQPSQLVDNRLCINNNEAQATKSAINKLSSVLAIRTPSPGLLADVSCSTACALSVDFFILEPRALNVAMFIGLHFAFGVVVSALYWLFDRTMPPAADREQVGYLIVTALGGNGLLLVIALFTVPSFCGCEPNYGFLAIILVIVASTALRHASTFIKEIPTWAARSATVIGYTSLALLLAIGLRATIDQIQRIL